MKVSIKDQIDHADLQDHVQAMKRRTVNRDITPGYRPRPDQACQIEQEHNERAKQLIECFKTPEVLAEFLHLGYRATAKALAEMHGIAIGPVAHDHGWRDCYGEKKRYFIRRAKWLMSPLKNWNGRV